MKKMKTRLSERLQSIVDALPLKEGMRILEIGCGSGATARAIVQYVPGGYVLGIDRSSKAIQLAEAISSAEIASGILSFRVEAIEDFELPDGEEKFDIALAVRVGTLDGRHKETELRAITQIKKALKKDGSLYIDGGNPLKRVF